MSKKMFPLLLLALASAAIAALGFTNTSSVALSVFGASLSLPVGLLLGFAYLLGVFFTLPLLTIRAASEAASQQRLAEWQQQDNKLALQVQTDREKQLEAKIATLETALQKALKR